MKKPKVFLIALLILIAACSENKDRYIDLRSGKAVQLDKDAIGRWVDAETRQPVYIYVDTKKHDTVYGKTGEVINGQVVLGDDNVYWFKADLNPAPLVEGESKRKVEDDGDIKMKTDDRKIKIDGETGEKKVKND